MSSANAKNAAVPLALIGVLTACAPAPEVASIDDADRRFYASQGLDPKIAVPLGVLNVQTEIRQAIPDFPRLFGIRHVDTGRSVARGRGAAGSAHTALDNDPQWEMTP